MTDHTLVTRAVPLVERHEALKRRIDAELRSQVRHWFPLSEDDLASLQALLAGGKRLRGALACLVAEALGEGYEPALPAALAVEIIQAASLVHDDFVDADTVRRGRPAAWTLLAPRRAVLLADLMFATAIEKMAQAGARECAVVAGTIATMAQGAFCEGRNVGTDGAAYKRIVFLKTGSLFAAAAQLGALAARATTAQLQAAARFGGHVGEAYQIADDLADLRRGNERSLAPALAYFTARGDAGTAGVAGSMEREIELAAAMAREQLACFPRTEATRLLAELPGAFARMAS